MSRSIIYHKVVHRIQRQHKDIKGTETICDGTFLLFIYVYPSPLKTNITNLSEHICTRLLTFLAWLTHFNKSGGVKFIGHIPPSLRNGAVKQLFSTCKLTANPDIYLSDRLCCKEHGTHMYKTAHLVHAFQ
jgi:hypothetical protein